MILGTPPLRGGGVFAEREVSQQIRYFASHITAITSIFLKIKENQSIAA